MGARYNKQQRQRKEQHPKNKSKTTPTTRIAILKERNEARKAILEEAARKLFSQNKSRTTSIKDNKELNYSPLATATELSISLLETKKQRLKEIEAGFQRRLERLCKTEI